MTHAQVDTLVFEFGGNLVKELLSMIMSDERCSMILEFEYASQDLFAQLLVDTPQWTEWMG
ncbi:hypothetical protein [Nostoc sp.]|uniref:hypothetical protein n=1 Tax=Nostoc sp. TaxID=1180 RepID=UPI002FF98114